MSDWCTLGALPICNQLQWAQTHISRLNVEASVLIQLLSCPRIVYLIWKGDMGHDCKSIFLEQNYLPEGGRLPQGLGTAFNFLKVCSFSRLSTDSFSCMTSFQSPEYKPSYISKYVYLTTLFLFPLGSLLHHISDYLLGTYLHIKCDLSVSVQWEPQLVFKQRMMSQMNACVLYWSVQATQLDNELIHFEELSPILDSEPTQPVERSLNHRKIWWNTFDIVSRAVICSINMEVEWNNLVAVFGQIVEPA